MESWNRNFVDNSSQQLCIGLLPHHSSVFKLSQLSVKIAKYELNEELIFVRKVDPISAYIMR